MKRGNVFGILVFEFLFLFGFNAALWCQEAKRVLFIGNSYVYTNNLPQVLSRVAEHNGKRIVCESSTIGGYTFGVILQALPHWQKFKAEIMIASYCRGRAKRLLFLMNNFIFKSIPMP